MRFDTINFDRILTVHGEPLTADLGTTEEDAARIETLRQSIRDVGLLSPISLLSHPEGDLYRILDGEARVFVMLRLKRTSVAAIIYAPGEVDPDLFRLCCNYERLRPWQLGQQLVALQTRTKLPPDKLARIAGLSRTYVRNLLKIEDCCLPEVLALYRRDYGALPVPEAIRYALLTAEEQLEKLRADYLNDIQLTPKKTLDSRRRKA